MQNIKEIFKKDQKRKKPPAYQWQELALKIIKELNIPNNKKSSVFKVCKEQGKHIIERCFNETKELCKGKDKWQYFFKLINNG